MWQKWQIITSYYLKLDRKKKNIYIYYTVRSAYNVNSSIFLIFAPENMQCPPHMSNTCDRQAPFGIRTHFQASLEWLKPWRRMWNKWESNVRFSCKSSFTLDLKPKKCTLWALRGYCVKSLCHLSGSSRLSLCCMNGNVHAWLFLCSGWVTLCFLWCGFMWLVCF